LLGSPRILLEWKGGYGIVVIAEVSIFPLGTGTPSVSEYVKVAIRELEASGLKCTPGPMGTTIEAETSDEAYAAIARAQAAVFELGAGRAYTVIKMDERRDVESRSVEDMMYSVRDRNVR
jgi:uncharacterized protein (TIGR00106 family)